MADTSIVGIVKTLAKAKKLQCSPYIIDNYLAQNVCLFQSKLTYEYFHLWCNSGLIKNMLNVFQFSYYCIQFFGINSGEYSQ